MTFAASCMDSEQWLSVAEHAVAFGLMDGPHQFDGFVHPILQMYELTRSVYLAGIGGVVVLLLGLISFRFARTNRQLRKEAALRRKVEEELRENQEELFRLASTDPLTGLWNRLEYERVAAREMWRSRRYGYPMAVIFLDLDNFKEINDRDGHRFGDHALRQVASVIRQSLRESDFVCRWGGDEFLILVPHTDRPGAAQLAERLRVAVTRCDFPDGVSLSVSLGVAMAAEDEGLDDLMRRADEALYQAKAKGRNRVEESVGI